MNLDLEGVRRFHGHWCPGLAMGIRVAEAALREVGAYSEDEEIVALVETDNCAVDAIQYFVGCTFGKGNLIHLDYGKNAFTFVRRSDGKAIRILVKPNAWMPDDPVLRALQEKARAGQASADEQARLRAARIQAILESPIEQVVAVREVSPHVPKEAEVRRSVTCVNCGEQVMETRAHLLGGELYCPPCFEERVQR